MYRHENYKYFARLLMTLAFGTLMYRVYQTKDVTDMSYLWIGLISLAQLFLLFYGFDNNKIGVIIPAFFVLSSVLYILYLKLSKIEQEEIIHILRNKDILQ